MRLLLTWLCADVPLSAGPPYGAGRCELGCWLPADPQLPWLGILTRTRAPAGSDGSFLPGLLYHPPAGLSPSGRRAVHLSGELFQEGFDLNAAPWFSEQGSRSRGAPCPQIPVRARGAEQLVMVIRV